MRLGVAFSVTTPSTPTVDEDIVIIGTLGSRPSAASGYAGRQFYATDTGLVYVCVPDGGGYAWNVVGAGGGWTKLASFNFAALPAQTIGSDGPTTIDGVACTKVNSAKESVAAAIVAGVGLVIQPVSASDYGGATDTAPSLRFSPVALAEKFGPFTPLRITCGILDDNRTEQFRGTLVAIENGSTRQAICKSVYTNSGGPSDIYIEAATFESGGLSSEKSVSGNKAIRVEFPLGIYGGVVAMSSAPYSGGALPAEADFDHDTFHVAQHGGGAYWQTMNAWGDWRDWHVRVGAFAAGSSGYSTTIGALDIEVFDIGSTT